MQQHEGHMQDKCRLKLLLQIYCNFFAFFCKLVCILLAFFILILAINMDLHFFAFFVAS